MALSYFLDENLRGPLWRAIERHNETGVLAFDCVRVGDLSELPLGTEDPDLLFWGQSTGRIFISRDKRTLADHLADHLSAGHHHPGIFVIRDNARIPAVIEFLVEAAHRSNADDWRYRIEYIP